MPPVHRRYERKEKMKPAIGIVTCGRAGMGQFIPQAYISAIEDNGGIPVVIPMTENENFYPHYGKICTGFLFCGGDDVTPLLFGEELKTDKGKTNACTDLFHLSFMKYALSTKLPVLAICRGMQILNIALGGTVFQDISLRLTPSLNHMQLSDSREDISHKITLSSNSILCNIFRNLEYVNSFHHQCIHVLGANLKVTAVASDGVIEAIESTDLPFVIGVQWHPECMYHSSPSMKELFLAFLDSAKEAKNLGCMLP